MMMDEELIKRILRAIPYELACELHHRLKTGVYDSVTRRLLRYAIKNAQLA